MLFGDRDFAEFDPKTGVGRRDIPRPQPRLSAFSHVTA
jgi:hypothetical protein